MITPRRIQPAEIRTYTWVYRYKYNLSITTYERYMQCLSLNKKALIVSAVQALMVNIYLFKIHDSWV